MLQELSRSRSSDGLRRVSVYLVDHSSGEIVLRASQLPHDEEIAISAQDGRRHHRLGRAAQIRCGAPLERFRGFPFQGISGLAEDTYEASSPCRS